MKRALTGLFFFSFFAVFPPVVTVAQSAAPCYSQAELEAEQLLRLHSELMVITVTCRLSSTGENLVPAYTGFTRHHLTDLQKAERVMIDFYKKHYGGNGVSRLDSLRTRLGNEFGQQIADVSAPVFCQQRRDKVIAFANATEPLTTEVERLCASARTYMPTCKKF